MSELYVRLYNGFMMWFYRRFLRDDCEMCGGTKGGIRGNENIIEKPFPGKSGETVRMLLCDYCSAGFVNTPTTGESG